MKHYRPISRTPAIAQSALVVKVEFKTSLSNTILIGTNVLTDNFATIATGLFQNALNLGEIVEIVIEDLGDIFGGGAGA
jgi:formate/nitrite transporter FocA (FNT family)